MTIPRLVRSPICVNLLGLSTATPAEPPTEPLWEANMRSSWFRKSGACGATVHFTATLPVLVCLCSLFATSIASFASSAPATAKLDINVNVLPVVRAEQMTAPEASIPQHQDIVYNFQPDVREKVAALACFQECPAAEGQRKFLTNLNREQETSSATPQEFTFVSK